MGQTFLERCVAIYRTLDDDLGLAYGLMNLGRNQLFGGEFDPANANLTESLSLARSAGDPNLLCIVLAPLGTLANLQGQHDRAIELLRESVTVGRTVQRADHRRFSVGRALMQLGRALFEQGKFDEAMVVFEDALAGVEAGRAGGFRYVVGIDRSGQADALRVHGADIVVDDLAELLDHS